MKIQKPCKGSSSSIIRTIFFLSAYLSVFSLSAQAGEEKKSEKQNDENRYEITSECNENALKCLSLCHRLKTASKIRKVCLSSGEPCRQEKNREMEDYYRFVGCMSYYHPGMMSY